MTILRAPAFLDRVERVLPGRLEQVEAGVRAFEQDLAEPLTH